MDNSQMSSMGTMANTIFTRFYKIGFRILFIRSKAENIAKVVTDPGVDCFGLVF